MICTKLFSPAHTALVLLALAALPAHAVVKIEDIHKPTGSSDERVGSLAPPTEAARVAATQGWTARWNRFGTVHTLHKPGGFLATGLSGDPETEARAWMKAHGSLFRLSNASIDALSLYRNVPLNQSGAQILLFRQMAGDVPVANEGRIKIGIVDGKLFWVASSSIGDIAPLPAPALTAAQAWLAAAARVPLGIAAPAVTLQGTEGDWTLLDAPGYTGRQRVRAAVIGMPGANAVPGFEANVVRLGADGHTTAYTAYINALDGAVLVVQDRVAQLSDAGTSEPSRAKADRVEPFQGEYPPLQGIVCGPCHGPFSVTAADNFSRLVATAISGNIANDITIDVYRDDSTCALNLNLVAHGDTGTSPEAAIYTPASGRVEDGNYFVEVCPFSATQLPPTTYAGSVLLDETQSPTSSNPRWTQFPVTPPLDQSSTDSRTTGCWFRTNPDGSAIPGCDEQLVDGSSHDIPWDYIGNAPSQTTSGNNARSYEGWNAAIGGGSLYQPAPTPSRDYTYPWGNTWFTAACNPAVINHATPASNDIDAAVTNLFTLHNRLHDFAYHLGLRERNGVAQTSNYGQTDGTREGDAELGFAQAGAPNGGFPSYLGRDNANQVTLQDGVKPLSNMYLWQTIGGVFYAPCVDGDFDGQIVAHEYGHLVSNRMTDPDQGLSGQQGRSMGEGWADLNAVMLFDELGLLPEGSPSLFSVGAYVTGDEDSGIRNYPITASPLNFSDLGYDIACESPITNVSGTCEAVGQVHADAEIWTALHYDIRQALVAKYNALGFPSTNVLVKRRCAEGDVPADLCPGQRRWSQLVHDGMILQPPSPTFIDARDAIIAADLARAGDSTRNWATNQTELWTAFARRGLGQGASAADPEDVDSIPGFDSPLTPSINVRFDVRNLAGAAVTSQVYVGHYEARATAAADTDAGTPLSDVVPMHPGAYEFVVRADGYGHFRFTRTLVGSGDQTVAIRLAPNHAALTAGAVASGSGEQQFELIDEREGTNWQALANTPSVDVARPAVTIALAGGAQTISRVQVSGMLEVVLGANLQNRFSSVHQFALSACNQASADCGNAANYTQVLVSPLGAFPSAGIRPLVTDMTLREFRFNPVTATHVRFTALHNKCTGTPSYHGYLGIPANEDADPTNNTDCRVANTTRFPARTADVRAAEVQVFGQDSFVVPPVFVDAIFKDGFEG